MKERPRQRPTSEQYWTLDQTGARSAIAPGAAPGGPIAGSSHPAGGAPAARPDERSAWPEAAPEPTDRATALERARLQAQAHQICPGCGTTMVDRGCKVRCLRCGFFLDCSDG